MKNLGLKKIMMLITFSGIAALLYTVPYLRFNFYDQVMVAWNLDDIQMGIISTAMGAMNFVCYAIGGPLAAKFSARNLLLVTVGASVILSLMLGFVTNFYALVAVHVLFSFFGIATFWSAYLTGVRGLGDESIQSKLYGSSETIRGCIQTVASFAFLGLMGIAASYVMGIRFVYIASAAFFAIFFVLTYLFMPKEAKKEETVTTETDVSKKKLSYLDCLKNKGVWITIFVLFCTYMTHSLASNYLSTYSVRVLGMDDSLASMVSIIRSYAIILPAGLLGGFVLSKFTYKGQGFIVFFIVLLAVLLGVIFTNKIPALCIVLTLLVSLLMNMMKATYWSIMGEAGISIELTALATGFISVFVFSIDLIMPPICSAWLDSAAAAGNIVVGFNKIFTVMSVCAALGILGSMILLKRTKSLEKAGTIEPLTKKKALSE